MVQAKQYGERVNIVKYVRVEKKWRFAAVVEKQGRVIRDKCGSRAARSITRRQVLPRMVPRRKTAQTLGWRV